MMCRLWSVSLAVSFSLVAGCGNDDAGDLPDAPDAGRDAADDEPSRAGDLLAVSPTHACALRQTGMYCWGLNFLGQLGDGSSDDSEVPVAADVDRDTVVE